MFIESSKIYLSTIECNSLKEKRSIIKSIISSVRSKFNVSILEISDNDDKFKGVIGVTFVSNEKQFSEQVVSKVISFIDKRQPGRIQEYDLDIYCR